MSKSTFIALDKKIAKLRSVVKSLDVKTLTTYCFGNLYLFGTTGQRVELKSPARQSIFLFGIACSQDEPVEPSENIDGKIKQIEVLLNDIFGNYLNAYFPTLSDLKEGLREEWYKVREVALPVFSGYFYEGKKVATSDFEDIIRVYFDGFEQDIKEGFGIDHIQMLRIGELISEQIQSRFDRINEIMDVLKAEHKALQDINIEDFSSWMAELKIRTEPLGKEYQELISAGASFSLDKLKYALGQDVLDKFANTFITKRGFSNEIKYITDDNPVAYKPVLTVDSEECFLASMNFYYEAIILNIERFFKTHKSADRFRKARDNRLEKESTLAFKTFLPKSAKFLESVYETNDSHNEHDLVILIERTMLIVEAKAAPRREPLRDPSKAYLRIRDDFKKSSGIQSGYKQANNLRQLVLNNIETPLYDKKGKLVHTISREDYDGIYCICITKDDFGMLATDLTLMLEKYDDETYPWVICIQDLKFFLTCLNDIGKESDFLLSYIKDRVKVNGRLLGADELEFAGAYLNYGGFESLTSDLKAKVFLDINESRVFDEIYLDRINGVKHIHVVKESQYNELNRSKLFAKINRDKVKRSDKKTKRKEQGKSRKNNR